MGGREGRNKERDVAVTRAKGTKMEGRKRNTKIRKRERTKGGEGGEEGEHRKKSGDDPGEMDRERGQRRSVKGGRTDIPHFRG